MPSLFSRSRTTSTPLKSQKPSVEFPSDEFGRVSSRGSVARVGAATIPGKKDNKNALEKTRSRTLSAAKGRAAPGHHVILEEEPVIPDGSFFPLNLEPPGVGDPANPSDSERGPVPFTFSFFFTSTIPPSLNFFVLPSLPSISLSIFLRCCVASARDNE
jgi:hypothetical protein